MRRHFPLILSLFLLTPVFSGAQVVCLTCELRTQKGDDFGDPSAPDFSVPGQVQVLTTNGEMLTWKDQRDETGIERFFTGKRPSRNKLKTYDVDAITYLEPWDPSIQVFPEFGGEKILYAGVTTAPIGRKHARWPEDDWRRRVQAFRFNEGLQKWIRVADSVFGDPPHERTWLGHGYGHHIIRDQNGHPWMFYEKVTSDLHDSPWMTEMYARRMLTPFVLSEIEIPILEFDQTPWPLARRYSGGALLEGPRPFLVEDYYVVSFSAGEYQSDRYGIHLAWSKNLQGPYFPFLNEKGNDLKDFAKGLRQKLSMTWGPGRAVLFNHGDQQWMLFHGILKDDQERMEHQERDVFLAPVKVTPHQGLKLGH